MTSIVLLIFYAFGVLAYVGISLLAVKQLIDHKLPHEKIDTPLTIFAFASALIIIISFISLSGLDWSANVE